eukprot:3268999-Prymnesium_polylepis.2
MDVLRRRPQARAPMRLVSLQVTLVCIAVGVAAGPVNLTEEYFDSQIYTSGRCGPLRLARMCSSRPAEARS